MSSVHDNTIEMIINDPDYDIKPNGDVFSKKRKNSWKQLKFSKKKGYSYLSFKKLSFKIAVHRLVYRKYVGPLDETLVINHIDGNKQNNHYSNLELVSVGSNNLHRFRTLKHLPVAGYRKLNPEVANEIRQLRDSGLTYLQILNIIGPKFGITSKSTISYICNNKTWIKEVTLKE